MATSDSSVPDALGFAQLLLNLVDDARRSSTYKLALLLALIDCCTFGTDAQGRAPRDVSTRAIARRVLELYWPQVRDYPTLDGGPACVLRQSGSERAVTVDAVRTLRTRAQSSRLTTPAAVERVLPQAYAAALDDVELNFVRMPLGRLQRPMGFTQQNSEYPRFLYDDSAFHAGVTPRQVREGALRVVLQPGVGDWLVGLAGLLRPLLELHWTREVAKFNGRELAEDRLRDFLFGAERENLVPVREGLLEAQEGRCFYCAAALVPRAIQIDHFIPWSRIPNDALGNLVLADTRCNNSKGSYYADLPLLERWASRSKEVLAHIADQASWPLRTDESKRVARGLYAHLAAGTPLWQEPGVFRVVDRAHLDDLLPLLEDR